VETIEALKQKSKQQGNIPVSQYQKSIPEKKLTKPGLLKRFLDWIAKGADKSNMGKASCPT
jgi:hypothetical protein